MQPHQLLGVELCDAVGSKFLHHISIVIDKGNGALTIGNIPKLQREIGERQNDAINEKIPRILITANSVTIFTIKSTFSVKRQGT